MWCETCKDWTLDNARHECSWCETKFTEKRLAEAKKGKKND